MDGEKDRNPDANIILYLFFVVYMNNGNTNYVFISHVTFKI